MMFYDENEFPWSLLNLLVTLALGGVLVWAVVGVRTRRGQERADALLNVLEMLGWLLMAGSLLLLLIAVAGPLFVLVFFVIGVALLVISRRYRDSERRALSAAMTIAAERGIPLGQAVRAFADDVGYIANSRVLALADLLEAGVPLDDAVRRSRIGFPKEVTLAVRVRGFAGSLGPLLRDAMRRATAWELMTGAIIEKAIYCMAILAVSAQILLFWATYLVPVYQEMCTEFEVDFGQVYVPGESLDDAWILLITFLLIGLAMLALALVMAYLRWLPAGVPLLQRLSFRYDKSNVLHCLALATQQRTSIVEALGVLQQHFPKRRIRRRLAVALRVADRGGHWSEGMRASGLLNRREKALLDAAERVGNLSWALEETAERLLHRALFRLRRIRDVAFPLVFLLLGIWVLTLSALQIVPLVRIIQHVF